MALLNWPPSKGPLPDAFRVEKCLILQGVKRKDFQFKQPPQASAERRHLLEAVMDVHGDPKVEEKVGMEYRTKAKMDTSFILDHPLSVVSRLEPLEADLLLHGVGENTDVLTRAIPLKRYEIPLTYPLTVGVELRVDPFELTMIMGDGKKVIEQRMSIGYVLWVVAQEYKRIYADWKLYKPWGHGIEDLVFRTMQVHRGSPNPWIELGFAS